MTQRSQVVARLLGLAVAVIYLALCAAALLFSLNRPANDQFSLIFLIVLTLPWSGIFATVSAFLLGLVFGWDPPLSVNIGMLIFFAFINATIIIIFSGRLMGGATATTGSGPGGAPKGDRPR